MECSERDEGNWVSKNILSFFALPCLLFVCPSSVKPKSQPTPKLTCHCHINCSQILIDLFGYCYCWIPMDPDASYWSWWIQLKMIDPWQSWWNLTKPNLVFNLDKFHPNSNPNPNPNSYPNPDTYPNSYLFLIWLWMYRAIYLQSSSHKPSVKTWSYIYTVWAQSSLHTFLIEGVLV